MWTRAEVKSRAKKALQKYYWYAVVMCFIAAVLGGGSYSGGVSVSTEINNGINLSRMMENADSFYFSAQDMMFLTMALVIVAIIMLAASLFGIFVGNPVQVGLKRYFLESREQNRSAGVATLFWVFNSGHYLNIVKIMFLKNLYTFLWSLLLVIPGVIKRYEYSMIPYLLAEYPDISSEEVFSVSREMTMGEKGNLFVLDLSFIGWNLLGALVCCGVGTYFVLPYMEATWTEVYREMNPRQPERQTDEVVYDYVYDEFNNM